MGKINNVVKVIEFSNDDDLYSQIDDLTNTDYQSDELDKPYVVTSINLINEKKALVYLQENLNVLPVHFFYCCNNMVDEIVPSEEPHNEEFMSIQEINLARDLGSIIIEDKEYEIDEVYFSMNAYGTRCVNFYLC